MPLDTELHKSAHKGGDLDELSWLVRASVDYASELKIALISEAWESSEGDIQVVKDLVLSGEINVNEKGAQDRTALHRAAGANHIEIIEFLLEAGAPVDCADRCLRTPLHWAAISGHMDATQLLLASGGDLRRKTMSGMNPLMCAVQQRRHAVAEMILDWSASCNEDDTFSQTETGEESEMGPTPTPAPAELCSMADVQGKTAAVIAKEGGDVAMQKLLKLYAPKAPSMLSTVLCCWPWSRARKETQQQHAPVSSVMTMPPSGTGSRRGGQERAMASSMLEERGRRVREEGRDGGGNDDFGVDGGGSSKTRNKGWGAWLCSFASSASLYEASPHETRRSESATRSSATTRSAALPSTSSVDSDGAHAAIARTKPDESCSSTSGTAGVGGRSDTASGMSSEAARAGFEVLFGDNISGQREGMRRSIPYYHPYRNPGTANAANVSVTCGPRFSEAALVDGGVGRESGGRGTSRERSARSMSSGGWHDSMDVIEGEWKKGKDNYDDTSVEEEEAVHGRKQRRKRISSAEGGQPWKIDSKGRRGDESTRAKEGWGGSGLVELPSATDASVGAIVGGGSSGPWKECDGFCDEVEDSIRQSAANFAQVQPAATLQRRHRPPFSEPSLYDEFPAEQVIVTSR